MHLRKSDVIAGLPAEVARQGLNTMAQGIGGVPTWSLPQIFQQPEDVDPAEFAEQLATAGLIQHRECESELTLQTHWMRTKHGGRVAAATFTQPITRKTADAVVAAAVANAAAFNEDDTKKTAVTELIVFGSYLDNRVDRMSDVDMAIKVGDRQPHVDRLVYAAASGRTFQNIVQRLCWPETEAYRAVRGRRRSLSLFKGDLSKLKIPETKQLVVFRDDRWPSQDAAE